MEEISVARGSDKLVYYVLRNFRIAVFSAVVQRQVQLLSFRIVRGPVDLLTVVDRKTFFHQPLTFLSFGFLDLAFALALRVALAKIAPAAFFP